MNSKASETNRIIFHIGAAKVGSSSLQMALSRSSRRSVEITPRPFTYVTWNQVGELVPDASGSLVGRESHSVSGFNLESLGEFSLSSIHRIEASLAQFGESGPVVMSSEAWSQQISLMTPNTTSWNNLATLLASEQLNFEAVLFVRPHIEWLESGYRQWGIWDDLTPGEWFDLVKSRRDLEYARIADRCRDLGFTSVKVLYSLDVVHSFFTQVLNLSKDIAESANGNALNVARDLDTTLFLLRHRHLRPSAHASHVEAILERVAAPNQLIRPLPLLLGSGAAEKAEEHFAGDRAALEHWLDGPSLNQFRENSNKALKKYSGLEPIDGRNLESTYEYRQGYSEGILVRLLVALMEFEGTAPA